jgi:hypothetical protein
MTDKEQPVRRCQHGITVALLNPGKGGSCLIDRSRTNVDYRCVLDRGHAGPHRADDNAPGSRLEWRWTR